MQVRVACDRLRSGSALLTAIAFAAVFSTIVGGLALYTVGSVDLASKQADYAASIHLADAGINYELRNIALNQFNSGYVAPTAGSPHTGSVSGVSGSFSVWVTDMNGNNWTPDKGDLLVWATGTTNGVTRKIQAHGAHGDGLFDNYAVYGLNSVTFSGSGSQVFGSIGTNGTVTASSSGSSAVTGTILLAGPNAGGVSGSNVETTADPIKLPTVDTIVNLTFPGPPTGWNWLTDNSPIYRSNPIVRTFAAGQHTLTPATTVAAGAPWTGTTPNGIKLKTADFNGLGTDASNNKTLIFPPGDYYLTDISLSGGTQVVIDNGGLTTGTGPGLVRIWMNGSNSNDSTSSPFIFTATGANAPQLFRLYYNKQAKFTIDGDTATGGAFYAVTALGGASFEIKGGSNTFGAVIADAITIDGNSTIQFPSNLIASTTDSYWLWFGIKDGWKEMTNGSGTTFPDGTSN